MPTAFCSVFLAVSTNISSLRDEEIKIPIGIKYLYINELEETNEIPLGMTYNNIILFYNLNNKIYSYL